MKLELEDICWDNDDSYAEHYEALVLLEKWKWLARDGEIIDMRRSRFYEKNLPWAINILKWMEKCHTDNTPYMHTEQYKYIFKKVSRMQDIAKALQAIFRGKKDAN